jgi:hypothetical protein
LFSFFATQGTNRDNMSVNSIIIFSSFARPIMDFLVSKPQNSHH